ncbi:hypothetical protein UB35_17915 [Photobacterium angustum]|nr:hypothetical protein UB35_17915 [Photobacterium angustum]PSV64919.1 hypothetical protein CTM95_17955 [Photobacterium angustum]
MCNNIKNVFESIGLIILNQIIDFDVVDKYDFPSTVPVMNHCSPRKKPQKLYVVFIVLFQWLVCSLGGDINAGEFDHKKAVIFILSCTGWFGEEILMSDRAGNDGI